MARKFPPPDAAENPKGEPCSNQQNGTAASANEGESTSNPQERNLGARPRTNSMRRPSRTLMSPEEAHDHRRRYDSLNLDSSVDAADLSRRHSIPLDLLEEGEELYLHFFHERLRESGLETREEDGLEEYHHQARHSSESDDGMDVAGAQRVRRRHLSMNLQNFDNPIWRQTGRELRQLADAFARSALRDNVRRAARDVQLTSLTKMGFFNLLRGLFTDSQNCRERILVLFFFCSDVAILAIQSQATAWLGNITRWTLAFIREQVCSWVYQNGGWEAVLRSGMNMMQSVAVIGMCAAVMAVCAIYIRKNW